MSESNKAKKSSSLDGIGIVGYRSYGETDGRFGPLGKVNIIIGQNNAGKSNVLSFLRSEYPRICKCIPGVQDYQRSKMDQNQNLNTHAAAMEIGLKSDERTIQERYNLDPFCLRCISHILRSNVLCHGDEIAWIRHEHVITSMRWELSKGVVDALAAEELLSNNDWARLWNRVTGTGGGDFKHDWIPGVLLFLSRPFLDPPKLETIEAIRKIEASGEGQGGYSGRGIIDSLARLQAPVIERLEDRKRFDGINEFVQKVLENPSARLSVPHDNSTIHVEMDGRILPLSHLGTGIHEIIILAVVATSIQDSIVCIEEPELHLHPILQKKLIRYFVEKTSNQYFITTHSAHFMDAPGCAVFHVRLANGNSAVTPVVTGSQKFSVCEDLGYKASDLLQSNCVIWVEGPSDRTYLNWWISSVDDSLVEGIHYSVMFYGGRLLSHLSASDDEVSEFISLRRLNRNVAIIIDSDKSAEDAEINETKKRLQTEFDQGDRGFAWVTAGREIENYISEVALQKAVSEVHRDWEWAHTVGRYDRCLSFTGKDPSPSPNKVKIASTVVKAEPELTLYDLKSRVDQVVDFIRKSNGMRQVSRAEGNSTK